MIGGRERSGRGPGGCPAAHHHPRRLSEDGRTSEEAHPLRNAVLPAISAWRGPVARARTWDSSRSLPGKPGPCFLDPGQAAAMPAPGAQGRPPEPGSPQRFRPAPRSSPGREARPLRAGSGGDGLTAPSPTDRSRNGKKPGLSPGPLSWEAEPGLSGSRGRRGRSCPVPSRRPAGSRRAAHPWCGPSRGSPPAGPCRSPFPWFPARPS